MKKKLESLYDESLSTQVSLDVLKKQKKVFSSNSSMDNDKNIYLFNDVKTVKEVMSDYGKNAGLSAKFGSFENFRINLILPETGAVSLYSYKFLKTKNVLMILVPDDNIDLRLINSELLVDGKSLQVLSTQTVKTTITETVRIGKDNVDKPFNQKVKFPLTVIKVTYSNSLRSSESKDLSGIVLANLFKNYKTQTVSGVFTQALLDSKVDYLTQELPNDECFSFISQYQKKSIF